MSFVHGLRCEQKGVVCHLVCAIDILAISVAVGRHADTAAVTETLRDIRGPFQSMMADYLICPLGSTIPAIQGFPRRQTSAKWRLRSCKQAVLKAVL